VISNALRCVFATSDMGNGSSTSWYWNFSCGGGGDSAPPAPFPQLKKLRGVTKLGLVEAMAALPLAMNAAMLQLEFLGVGCGERRSMRDRGSMQAGQFNFLIATCTGRTASC